MEYLRTGNHIVVRFDRGEEILGGLKALALKENVRLASVSAIGAVGSFTVSAFKTGEKKYLSNEFSGDYEIVSLTGTVTVSGGDVYLHLHMSAADECGRVVGGHLNRAEVSSTCEMVVSVLDGRVDRSFSEEIGLNLMEFGRK